MPKLIKSKQAMTNNNQEITSNEIQEFLDSQSDFSLEMKALSYLKNLGFYTEHGGTYTDPIKKINRQFDIRSVQIRNNKVVKLAIECKAISKQSPLVIQRINRSEEESRHNIISIDFSNTGIDCDQASKTIRSTFGNSPTYEAGEFVGKSNHQLIRDKSTDQKLKSKDSETYEKWSQSIASAHDLITEFDRSYLRFLPVKYSREEHLIHEQFVLPVLVVSDECLWCVDYNDNGERQTEPQLNDDIDFYIGQSFPKTERMSQSYEISHLKILTLKGFKKFVDTINKDECFWPKIFTEDYK